MSFEQEYIDAHIEIRRQWITCLCETLDRETKSPIEFRFGVALLSTELSALTWTTVFTRLPDSRSTHGFFIIPQFRIGQYFADFALFTRGDGGESRLVVECDGHDFHEKTKEQAAHDKARDRALLDSGWPVMRFTGSEIHKDAPKCAKQAVDYLVREIAKQRVAA